MSVYLGKKLTARRDRCVVYDNCVIGTVSPDPADHRVNHGWVYAHVTGVTLKDVNPGWRWPRTVQGALTKQDAAGCLADLHLAIQSLADTNLNQLKELMKHHEQ
jgi:hypothetical protein